jgi:hypothetical protein
MRKIYEVKRYNQKRIFNFITSGNVAFDFVAHGSGAGERLFYLYPRVQPRDLGDKRRRLELNSPDQ